LERVCPLTEVDCPHSEFGFCLEKFPRSSQLEHLKECPVEKCKEIIYGLKKENENLQAQLMLKVYLFSVNGFFLSIVNYRV
jgi:hypothetical protein